MWYLLWQMANDYSIFLNSYGVSVRKLPGSSTQFFTNCHFKNVHVYVIPTYAESLLVVCDPFGHFAHAKIFANKNLCWAPNFVRATIHENWISWKFSPKVCQKVNTKLITKPAKLHLVPVHSPWHHVRIDFVSSISPPSLQATGTFSP